MIGILLGLIVLMVLAYLGWSIIWIAPISAGIVAVFGGIDLLEAYTGPYMEGFADFTKEWFPLFMLGAIFGKLMEVSGMAQSVASKIIQIIGAKRATIGVVLASAVLAYGGISVFVVVFCVYPLALKLFEEADIPKKLMPGSIIAGMMTFAMTALPGTPQIQNIIPTDYFHTDAAAAPLIGLAATVVMAGGSIYYLKRREKTLKKRGEGFIPSKSDEETAQQTTENTPNVILSLLPLIAVIITLNLFKWDIIVALLTGIILILLLSAHKLQGFIKAMNDGASNSVMAMINTSAAVGFGTVVQAVPGFKSLSEYILGIDANPLISMAIASNVLSGATGSASGGLGITMEALGDKYYEIAQSANISPEVFHRIASISSGGLDALPHNGAVITILIVTGLTHKDSYRDIVVIAIVFPILSLIPAILLASIGVV